MDLHKFGKLLRYSLQFMIVYMILRYAPQIKLNSNMSLVIALVLTSLCVIIEFLYKKLLNGDNDENCNVCNIPPPETTPSNCRMVCDVEPFDGKINNEIKGTFEQGSTLINIPISQMTQSEIMNEMKVREQQQQLMDNVEKKYDTKTIALQKDVIPNTFNMPSMNTMYNEQEKIDPTKNNPNNDIGRNGNLYDPNAPTMQDISSIKPLPLGSGGMFTDMTTPDYMSQGTPASVRNELLNKKYNEQRQVALDHRADPSYPVENYQEPGKLSQKNKPVQRSVKEDGYIINEYDYDDYDHNTLPLAQGWKWNPEDVGYYYLVPTAWSAPAYRNINFVPKSERNEVMPVLDGGTVNLKDFYSASSFTGRQGLNVSYINDKLNAGR